MIHKRYLELVAGGLGLSSAEHKVLPSHTVGHDGSLFHSEIPLKLSMNLTQADAFPAIRALESLALSSSLVFPDETFPFKTHSSKSTPAVQSNPFLAHRPRRSASRPRGTPENRPIGDTSKPANGNRQDLLSFYNLRQPPSARKTCSPSYSPPQAKALPFWTRTPKAGDGSRGKGVAFEPPSPVSLEVTRHVEKRQHGAPSPPPQPSSCRHTTDRPTRFCQQSQSWCASSLARI